MPSNQFRQSAADPAAKADSKTGYTVDPGPYEAIVMGHVQGSRMGQLQVYIPDWGGSRTDPSNQIVVSYASPFYGTTYGTNAQLDVPGALTSGQSYGMWMVPPDVGNKVLVTFAAGDRNRGYWFACIYDSPSHHMVPGNGRAVAGKAKTIIDPTQSGQLTSSATKDSDLPVTEYSTGLGTAFTPDGLTNTPRYAHPIQSMRLIAQGLDRDPVRGAISSSSLREAPSNVFGISTPGRSATKDSLQRPGAKDVNSKQAITARTGGHSFVMDDGDKDGNDQLIRLRTAGGHQILMNDTAEDKGVLYIASSSGNQWLEFSSTGAINVYGAAGINMRSVGPMNFHCDTVLNINSKGSVNINGDMGVKITSLTSASIESVVSASVKTDGILSLSAIGMASLSSGAILNIGAIGATSIKGATVLLNSPSPKGSIPIPVIPVMGNQLPDVTFNGKQWQYAPGAIRSICTVVPAHEPWLDPSTKKRPVATAGSGIAGMAVGAATSIAATAASKFF